MKRKDLLGVFLAAAAGVYFLSAMLIRAFAPAIILPRYDGMLILAISLAALVLDFYVAKRSARVYPALPVYAALVFGLFPWLSCFEMPLEALKGGILGAVIFTVTAFLFDSLTNRLESGNKAPLAPLISAFCIYLSATALTTII